MANNYEIFKQAEWWYRKYDGRKKMFRSLPMSKQEFLDATKKAVHRRYFRATADDYVVSKLRKSYLAVKEWAKPEHGNYQKVAMYGNTWLYLCSPIFGHKDYNKSRLLEIKGHEKQCEWLINVSKRVAKGG